ncbi:trypsin-like peptidase domain-containing protein [Haloarculaceae archaeon H-GB2-1]|nr:trypsin-like peptidase domain-containing protein [Haloarculaceae archaeon H-GB1-1]MEA5387414.1 trypsin-like peptidase domain-containing protein [Haloarculaceae archaeon H-GB11]MEA5408887.1 trypsin-like peptidase domain-containing protein [Haloarculaceae archaeon H-GB2-1]
MDRAGNSRRRFLAACGAALGASTAGCAYAPQSTASDATANEQPTQTPAEEALPDSDASYTQAYRNTVESVVEIRVKTASGSFGQGSGFVYDDRHLVTNQHVVDGASDVHVRFHDGGWQRADLAGADVYSDLAVLEIRDRPDSASPVSLVESDPAIGTEVIAIGNPFGYTGSVSAGIVSGVDRTLPAANGFSIPDAIQTDAAVNPGNSGGPLVTLDGDGVGVINAGSGDNIGFAISAPLINRVAPSLVARGSYDHSYMGVRLMSVTPLVADANDLDRALGVYIDDVLSGSPSDGVLQGSDGQTTIDGQQVPTGGDVITRLDDTPVPTRQALSSFLALETSPGSTVSVELQRDGSRQTVELTLGSRPEP